MRNRGILYALLAVLMWSTVATAFKLALKYTDYKHLLLVSTLTSLFVFFITVIIEYGIKGFLINRKSIIYYMLLALINPFLYYTVLFNAYSLLPAQIAQILNYTWPIILVIFSSLFLKEKITTKSIIGIILGFLGVIIISLSKGLSNTHISKLGIFIALLSAFIWAFFWIINVKQDDKSSVRLFYIFLFGFIYILIFSLFFNPDIFDMNIKGVIFSSYAGIFEMGITFLIWEKALKYAQNTSLVSNMIYLVPFISFVFIRIFLKEHIMIYSIIGLTLIITGIVMTKN